MILYAYKLYIYQEARMYSLDYSRSTDLKGKFDKVNTPFKLRQR